MTLKSVTRPPHSASRYNRLTQNWDCPPADGKALADVYAWEDARLAVMRGGDKAVGPLVYGWVPARSISLSRREANALGVNTDLRLQGFTAEPLAIRGTGGTAVPQGPGTMNITFFTVHDTHPGIREFYDAMCNALQTGLRTLGFETTIGPCAGSFCDGDYNLLHGGRKLIGTAQRWCRAKDGRTLGVHHAVVLLGADPDDLCNRLTTLYAAGGQNVRYDPTVHSAAPIDADTLRAALKSPLDALVHGA